jgi:hypothetical protein
MFRQLAFNRLSANPTTVDKERAAEDLLSSHPFQIASQLEDVWDRRLGASAPTTDPGGPANRSRVKGFPVELLPFTARPPEVSFRWDHLVYAYMVENTRLYEIFRRVLHELLHGEKLGTPTPESVAWLRTTEELFYADSAPFRIINITSHIRPDLRATRRNAYQRMFGMDLNHGSDDGKPHSYIKAEAANSDFVSTFEEFLREVWVGMTYVTATSSSNPTDNSKIAELAEKLFDMLISRRQNGNLAREEFDAVSMMSWFHLTLEYNSSIVKSLRAEASGVEQRLFKIAERVGLPAHGLSKDFFDIADPISRVLIEIETGDFNRPDAVSALYTPSAGGLEADMRTIITHWTAITGHDVKARKVAAS